MKLCLNLNSKHLFLFHVIQLCTIYTSKSILHTNMYSLTEFSLLKVIQAINYTC